MSDTQTQPKSKSRPSFSQTRVPTSLQGNDKFKRDQDRHYMLVEGDDPSRNYESLLSHYLDEVIDQKGETPYESHGYVAGECPSKRWTLVSCTKAYFNFMMKKNDILARQMLAQPEGVRTTDGVVNVEIGRDVSQNGGRPYTIDQLNNTFRARDAQTGYPMGQQMNVAGLGDFAGA